MPAIKNSQKTTTAKKRRSKKTAKSTTKSGGKLVATKRKTSGSKSGERDYDNGMIMQRLGMAGGVAITVAVIVVGLVLWTSGIVGVMAENITKGTNQQIAKTMIASGMGVDRITVTGREKTSLDAIENAIGAVQGTSLAHFNPHEVRARIEEIGWVRKASVTRLWPDEINVSIRERTPAAVWQMSQALRLIDHDGAIIREIGAYEFSNLPLIVGSGAPEAAAGILSILQDMPVFNGRITALVRVSGRRWNLRMSNNMDVKLPEYDYETALNELALLQESSNILDRNFKYIDFRDPERAFFRCAGASGNEIPALDVLKRDFSCAQS